MHLWIIRHAKSSWAEAGQADFERPLNGRGKQDGPRMASWLSQQQYTPDWFWVSTAIRAQATADYFQGELEVPAAKMQYESTLYHAGPETLVDVVAATPVDVSSVAVVAHNPGLTYWVNWLAGESLTDNLPTCAVACMRLPSEWQSANGCDWTNLSLGAGAATLENYMTPKKLPG